MNCLILAIGNELLNGEILETNASWLQKRLLSFGLKTGKVSILPDHQKTLESGIQKGIREFSYLFIMGGLGPTEDDVTRYAVAGAVERKLVQNQGELKILKEKFDAFRRDMSPNNEKQTWFPEGAVILPNPIGTASGFSLTEKKCRIFVLPGVPSEMKHIYENEIIPLLNREIPEPKIQSKLVVKTIGTGESVLDAIIKEKIIPLHEVRWEIIAKGEGVFIKFYPLEDPKDDAWKNHLKETVEERIGPYLYGYDDEDMGEIIAGLLLEKNLTLGCVESCTGGYISKYLTDRPGSSAYFSGSLITYSNEVKNALAGVDLELIQKHGAVSGEVAEALARGGKKALGSPICLSVTGVAGPDGGSADKPVGTVWFGIINEDNKVMLKKRMFNGDREDIRRKSLFYGLNLVRLLLQDKLTQMDDIH